MLTSLIVVITSLFRYRANHYVVYLKLIQCLLVTQLYLTLPDPMDCSPSRVLCPWNSPGKNTGMGCHSLLQGIFLTCELYFNKTGKNLFLFMGKKNKNKTTGWVQQGGDEFYIYFSNLIKIYNRIHNLRVERIWEITISPIQDLGTTVIWTLVEANSAQLKVKHCQHQVNLGRKIWDCILYDLFSWGLWARDLLYIVSYWPDLS